MITDTEVEVWRVIEEFPNYDISNLGQIVNNKTGLILATSLTPFGHVKITLFSMADRTRHTRSVAVLVAKAFVESPRPACNYVIALDGNVENVAAYNLAWRPRWLAWKYVRQLKEPQPRHYYNLLVQNMSTGDQYESIIQAGMTEGLLFHDIWKSTFAQVPVYPYYHLFEIIGRV